MNYGSLFSGIGGELGLERAGMKCLWQVEADPYRRAVLERHWPRVERYDDVRAVDGRPPRIQRGDGRDARVVGRQQQQRALCSVDLIAAGPPCQDLSVAGRRAGLSGSRSGLFFEFVRIIGEVQPRWFLMEQVPGLLSSNGGRDFGIVIDAFTQLGYGVAWRILDSRFFGVPQRRRRIYIVGHTGGLVGRAAAVLFEPEGVRRHPETGGEAGEGVARSLKASAGSSGPKGHDHETYVAEQAGALDKTFGHHGLAHSAQSAVAGHYLAIRTAQTSSNGHGIAEGEVHTLDGTPGDAVESPVGVRRLLPVECERLQSFPDDWTQLGDTKDGPRYAALGDSWTVNVIQWIGERIMLVDCA